MALGMNQSTTSLAITGHDRFGGVFPQQVVSSKEIKTLWYGKQGHYGYPSMSLPNVGGSFFLDGFEAIYSATDDVELWVNGNGGPNGYYSVGHLYADCPSVSHPGGVKLPDSYGATAYAKMKPTKPVSSELNALYELKDLPGMIRQLDGLYELSKKSGELMQAIQKNGLHKVANYHLAVQFGWKPLLKDIINFCNKQQAMQKKLSWLLAHEGKPIRTSVTLLDTSSEVYDISSPTDWGAFFPIIHSGYYAGAPSSRTRITTYDKVWANARFRFWLPPGPRDVNFTRRMKAALYGYQPTPSAVWNALPWAWLVDWTSNAGDIISNLDAGVADKCAADYFYIMRETGAICTKFAKGQFLMKGAQLTTLDATSVTRAYSKTRSVGDPFGFSTNPNGLNATQLSILGALGLSKLK